MCEKRNRLNAVRQPILRMLSLTEGSEFMYRTQAADPEYELEETAETGAQPSPA